MDLLLCACGRPSASKMTLKKVCVCARSALHALLPPCATSAVRTHHSSLLPHSLAQSEWVYLIPDNFGKQRVDGWVCYPKHSNCASGCAGADAEDAEAKVERMRIDAEVLYPLKQL